MSAANLERPVDSRGVRHRWKAPLSQVLESIGSRLAAPPVDPLGQGSRDPAGFTLPLKHLRSSHRPLAGGRGLKLPRPDRAPRNCESRGARIETMRLHGRLRILRHRPRGARIETRPSRPPTHRPLAGGADLKRLRRRRSAAAMGSPPRGARIAREHRADRGDDVPRRRARRRCPRSVRAAGQRCVAHRK